MLQPENISLCFSRFPYPVDRVTGSVSVDLLEHFYRVALSGYSGTQPIYLQGTWKGQGDDVDARFDIDAHGIPLDEKLLTALQTQPVLQKLARSFNATGRGDCCHGNWADARYRHSADLARSLG